MSSRMFLYFTKNVGVSSGVHWETTSSDVLSSTLFLFLFFFVGIGCFRTNILAILWLNPSNNGFAHLSYLFWYCIKCSRIQLGRGQHGGWTNAIERHPWGPQWMGHSNRHLYPQRQNHGHLFISRWAKRMQYLFFLEFCNFYYFHYNAEEYPFLF